MNEKQKRTSKYDFTVQYDRKAYSALTDVSFQLFQKHSMQVRIYPFAIGLMIVASVSLYSQLCSPSRSMAWIIVNVAVLILFFALIPLSGVAARRKYLKKAIKKVQAEGEFPFNVCFEFYENEIEVTVRGNTFHSGYDRIDGIVEYREWIFLFMGQRAYILNDSVFRSAEDKNDFLSFINKEVGIKR